MATAEVLQRLTSRGALADNLLNQLRAQVETLRKSAVAKSCRLEEEKLRADNEGLRREVETLKQRLIQAEVNNGIKQVPCPGAKTQLLQDATKTTPVTVPKQANAKPETTKVTKQEPSKEEKKQPAPKKEETTEKQPKKEAKAEKKPDSSKPGQTEGGDKVDVSRLNMRIGKIVDVKKHPDADSLYVEEVDVGEAKNRTIVSGLVQHVPLEKMQNRVAVFLLNLKPAKMRGILSEGMIMCASTPEKVEIIEPPVGVSIGERVTVDGYPGGPDEQLNPKKKIWEQIQPELRIDSEGRATYKGALWNVENKGPFRVPSMTGCGIK